MQKDIVVIALGNDILGDDGAAFVAANTLSREFIEYADFEFVSGGGLELLDYLEGRKYALVIDTISIENEPPGKIIEYDINDFANFVGSSPHYMGLPEVYRLAGSLELQIPGEIKILAIVTEIQNTVTEKISENIINALPVLIDKASGILNEWVE